MIVKLLIFNDMSGVEFGRKLAEASRCMFASSPIRVFANPTAGWVVKLAPQLNGLYYTTCF